jgi:hypothetical protein
MKFPPFTTYRPIGGEEVHFHSFLTSALNGGECKGEYTLVLLTRIVTPYRDSVDGSRDRVTYQKLVTR